LMRIELGDGSTSIDRPAIIYQHASDDRDRVIADTIGAATSSGKPARATMTAAPPEFWCPCGRDLVARIWHGGRCPLAARRVHEAVQVHARPRGRPGARDPAGDRGLDHAGSSAAGRGLDDDTDGAWADIGGRAAVGPGASDTPARTGLDHPAGRGAAAGDRRSLERAVRDLWPAARRARGFRAGEAAGGRVGTARSGGAGRAVGHPGTTRAGGRSLDRASCRGAGRPIRRPVGLAAVSGARGSRNLDAAGVDARNGEGHVGRARAEHVVDAGAGHELRRPLGRSGRGGPAHRGAQHPRGRHTSRRGVEPAALRTA